MIGNILHRVGEIAQLNAHFTALYLHICAQAHMTVFGTAENRGGNLCRTIHNNFGFINIGHTGMEFVVTRNTRFSLSATKDETDMTGRLSGITVCAEGDVCDVTYDAAADGDLSIAAVEIMFHIGQHAILSARTCGITDDNPALSHGGKLAATIDIAEDLAGFLDLNLAVAIYTSGMHGCGDTLAVEIQTVVGMLGSVFATVAATVDRTVIFGRIGRTDTAADSGAAANGDLGVLHDITDFTTAVNTAAYFSCAVHRDIGNPCLGQSGPEMVEIVCNALIGNSDIEQTAHTATVDITAIGMAEFGHMTVIPCTGGMCGSEYPPLTIVGNMIALGITGTSGEIRIDIIFSRSSDFAAADIDSDNAVIVKECLSCRVCRD